MKFQHVFFLLVLLSALSAFVIQPKYTDRVRNVQAVFAPVSAPTRHIAASLSDRFSKHEEPDHRALVDIRDENLKLRATLMSVTAQLEELKRITHDRNQLGDIQPLCTPLPTIATGSDAHRESIGLGASPTPLVEGMPVLYSDGVVGKISRGGSSGAQVQLVTDRGFSAQARFVHRDLSNGAVQASARQQGAVLVQGAGIDPATERGYMVVSLPARDAEAIAIGDELTLDDPEWPKNLLGRPLGRVIGKSPRHDLAQYVEIRVMPLREPKKLDEVMVMTRVVDLKR